MANEFTRSRRDLALTKTGTLSNANTAAYSGSIDLGQVPTESLDKLVFEIAVPATATLVNTKVMTLTVEDSANNSSFAAIDPLISTTITGTAGNVSAAKTVRFRLPPNARRYVRIGAVTSSDGGNNTTTTYTFSALT